jgi:hypothetical protein
MTTKHHHILCPVSTVGDTENCVCYELNLSYRKGDAEAWLAAHDKEVLETVAGLLRSEMHGIPMHLFDGVVDVDTFSDAWEIATNYAIDAIHKSGEQE